MTETSIAQNPPILVAIDIAKARHEVLIAIPGKKRRRRLTVLNQLDERLGTHSSTTTHWRAVLMTFRNCPKPMTSYPSRRLSFGTAS